VTGLFMRINFFRRFRILPGIGLNVSKRSVSVSIGVRGLKTTFSKRGRTTTVGLPGSGLSVSLPSDRTAETARTSDLALLEKALGGKRRSRD
jgi:hypothetical protein